MADWLTPLAVAEHLDLEGAETEQRMVDSTAAVRAAVERRRSDLIYTDDTTVPADVRLGGILWAALLYQQRGAPSGFAGYDAETALMDAGSKRAEIFRLLGWRRPVTA